MATTTSYTDWTGPRVAGGTYFCGYWREMYTVLAIHRDGDGYPLSMDVRGADGQVRNHATGWDSQHDRIVL